MTNQLDLFEIDNIILAARTAHEANRAYCLSIGDSTQVTWEWALDWQKESAKNGVIGVMAGNTPKESHASWMQQKIEDGWKYGPVKDGSNKEHPCIVPYDQLPLEQMVKDHLFVAVVRAVLDVFATRHSGGTQWEQAQALVRRLPRANIRDTVQLAALRDLTVPGPDSDGSVAPAEWEALRALLDCEADYEAARARFELFSK